MLAVPISKVQIKIVSSFPFDSHPPLISPLLFAFASLVLAFGIDYPVKRLGGSWVSFNPWSRSCQIDHVIPSIGDESSKFVSRSVSVTLPRKSLQHFEGFEMIRERVEYFFFLRFFSLLSLFFLIFSMHASSRASTVRKPVTRMVERNESSRG